MVRGLFGTAYRVMVKTRGLRLRYWWVALISLGFLPALMFSNVLLNSTTAADWSCSRVEFGAEGSQDGGCSIITGELIASVAVAWAAPLFVLVALLYLFRRARQGEDDRGGSSSTTGGGEAAVDSTSIFVRTAAVLVGMANVLVIGDPRGVFSADGPPLPGTFLLAMVAGLVASEIVLRIGSPALSSGFFARYGITVLGLCLGGAILGGLSMALGVLTGSGAQGSGWGIPVYAALAYGLIAAVVGGVMGALEGLILAFPLAAILGKFRRPPRGQRRGALLPGLALPCLLLVAIVVSYASTPPTPPVGETASLSNNPPISCPEYLGEEVGAFEGPGDQITPAFETNGDGWDYEYSSSDSGSLSTKVLDEDGNEVESQDEPLPEDEFFSGSSVGGTEFASSGTFSIEINADEDLDYRVLVCD